MPNSTIKSLVFDHVRRHGGVVDYESLTMEVLDSFPYSKWNPSHWAYYRTQIHHGRYKHEFDEIIRNNVWGSGVTLSTIGLKGRRPGRPARDSRVKEIGDKILREIREKIESETAGNLTLKFLVNRWVFARLQADEIRSKQPIKKALWVLGMKKCQQCGSAFADIKNVELHRIDEMKGYAGNNCTLVCRDCHNRMHAQVR